MTDFNILENCQHHIEEEVALILSSLPTELALGNLFHSSRNSIIWNLHHNLMLRLWSWVKSSNLFFFIYKEHILKGLDFEMIRQW